MNIILLLDTMAIGHNDHSPASLSAVRYILTFKFRPASTGYLNLLMYINIGRVDVCFDI